MKTIFKFQSADSHSSVCSNNINNIETPNESPEPSPCKLIQKCKAATNAGTNDIELAAEPNDDSGSDNEQQKPRYK